MDKISSSAMEETTNLLFNTTRRKTKLSICDFNFGNNYKRVAANDRKNSLM